MRLLPLDSSAELPPGVVVIALQEAATVGIDVSAVSTSPASLLGDLLFLGSELEAVLLQLQEEPVSLLALAD